MLDTDGQRPAEIAELKKFVKLAQVTLEGPTLEMQSERALESVHVAADAGMQHALVVSVDGEHDRRARAACRRARARSERGDGGRGSSEHRRAGRSGSPVDDAVRADRRHCTATFDWRSGCPRQPECAEVGHR